MPRKRQTVRRWMKEYKGRLQTIKKRSLEYEEHRRKEEDEKELERLLKKYPWKVAQEIRRDLNGKAK